MIAVFNATNKIEYICAVMHVEMILRDILVEIAARIKTLRDFMTFTAVCREWRTLLYRRELTRHFCVVIKNYTNFTKELAAFAEKAQFYIEAKKNYRNLYFEHYENDIGCIICSNCIATYKFTKNELFAKLCRINELINGWINMDICKNCDNTVCRYKGTWDYAEECTWCLNCVAPTKICKKCGIFPITGIYVRNDTKIHDCFIDSFDACSFCNNGKVIPIMTDLCERIKEIAPHVYKNVCYGACGP